MQPLIRPMRQRQPVLTGWRWAALVWAAVAASAMAQNAPAPAASASEAQASSAKADAQNPMLNAVTQRGIQQCAARVEQLSRAIGMGPQTSGMLIAPAQPVDQRLFSVALLQPVRDNESGFVGIDFAPNQANGCGAAMQAVAYWPQGCEALASGQMAKLKKLPPIRPDVLVLEGGPNTKVFLLKAGASGCVSIKKEVVL